MRLTCPNCGAQYEVPEEVIPFEGRDVQCSNCGKTWFQPHPKNEASADSTEEPALQEPEPIEDIAEQTEDAPERLQKSQRGIDPSVSDILKEEAAREAQLRETEASESVESQPDLGIEDVDDESERRARQARERMARIKGETIVAIAEDGNGGTRRGLLPNIEEINSSLRGSETTENAQNIPADPADLPARPPKRGFARGLALSLLIIVILVFIYKMAPEIAQAVPQADPMLSAYVALVDQGRFWLDTQVGPLVKPYLGI